MAMTITKQPRSYQTIRLGGTFSLEVTLQDAAGVTYNWYKLGTPNPIAGQNTKTLTINPVGADNFGVYFCRMSKAGESDLDSQRCIIEQDTTAPSIEITVQPDPVAVDVDAQVQLTCTATTNELVLPLKYTWVHNNKTVLADQANGTITITNSTLDTAGQWFCMVSCGESRVSSRSVLVEVNNVPFIRVVDAPADLTAAENTPVEFSVGVVTSHPDLLTYKWQKNGADVDVNTNPTAATAHLVVDTVAAADNNAKFKCIVGLPAIDGHAAVNVTSAEATLTVGAAFAVTFGTQPAAQADLWPGAEVTLSSEATANDARYPVSYQWYKDNVAIPGATAKDYVFVLPDNFAGTYKVVGAAGPDGKRVSATSNDAALSQKAGQVTLNVTQQPQAVDVASGVPFALSVIATTDNPAGISYQWKKDNVAIDGATSSILAFNSPGPLSAGMYKCTLTAGKDAWARTLDSDQVRVQVTDGKQINTAIGTQPVAQQNKMLNEYVELSVVANTDGYPLKYQWYRNNEPVKGATDTKLRFVLTADKVGTYFVNCISGGVVTKSTEVQVTLTAFDKVTITEQPKTVVWNVLQQAAQNRTTLRAAGVGEAGAAATYQWYKDGAQIAGQTNQQYEVTNIADKTAHFYQCKITASGQSILTKPAWVIGTVVESDQFVHPLPHRGSSFTWKHFLVTDAIAHYDKQGVMWQADFPADKTPVDLGIEAVVFAMAKYGAVEVMESRNGRVLTFDSVVEKMVPTNP